MRFRGLRSENIVHDKKDYRALRQAKASKSLIINPSQTKVLS